MKKQILIGAILIIVIAVSAWNVSLGLKHDSIPEIAFVNLEQLHKMKILKRVEKVLI